MKSKFRVAIASIACAGALSLSPMAANAGISFTGMGAGQSYEQAASGETYLGSSFYLALDTAAATDFTGASVAGPGGATTQLNWPPALTQVGTYAAFTPTSAFNSSSPSTSLAAMNTAYPFGTYTFTATNSNTNTQQTATLNYDANYFPTVTGGSGQTVVPALTGASYIGLQGLNAGSQYTLNFNAFTGSPVVCCGEVNPATYIGIFSQSTGNTVYNSGPLTDATTSLTLAANSLQANTAYGYDIYQNVGRHCGIGQACGSTNPIGYYMNYSVDTYGLFATANTVTPPPVTVNLQGGTLANPTSLAPITTGRIGQINGAIGGNTATDFYQFYWAGGDFASNVAIAGANPLGMYEFELLDYFGGALTQDITLNAGDNFAVDLTHLGLGAGTYEIGLVADSPYDPNYSIVFDTPVEGGAPSVPEPATLSLLGLGLAGIGFMRKRKSN